MYVFSLKNCHFERAQRREIFCCRPYWSRSSLTIVRDDKIFM